jgi:hypothetical protein
MPNDLWCTRGREGYTSNLEIKSKTEWLTLKDSLIIHQKPIWVIIHLYMEMSQGNSLYSYLKQQKCLFVKTQQEGKTGPVWGLIPVGEG